MRSNIIMKSLLFLTIILLITDESICNQEVLRSPSVVIVGAGASGIAAATKLLENNITNLVILEAKNRIGGRVHTVPFGNGVVDLGAEWCHGEENNVVYELANKYGLLGSEEIEDRTYYSTGKMLDKALTSELSELFEDILSSSSTADNVSMGEYFRNRYLNAIQELYKNDSEKLDLATEYVQVLLTFIMEYEGTFSAFESSVKHDYVASRGYEALNWKNKGYKTILDILTKKYPNPEEMLPIDDKILFNKEVVEIIWEENQQVTVKCNDRSVHRADHVIVTVSLGVLKCCHQTLFSPALPEEKINVIQDLGFQAAGKVFLHFPTAWWQSQNSSSYVEVNFLWNEADKEAFLNSSEDDNSWLANVASVFVEKENPNVVMAWLAGPQIPEIERFPNDVVANGIMRVIRKFLAPFYKNITNPDSIRRHGWYNDPHIRGTYSFQTVKSRQHGESPEVILSKPLGGGKLLFAGEATNSIHYSTVHGAIESGRREAQRLIDLY